MSQFYAIDSSRVSLREYWWGTKSPLVLLGWILKWLRVRFPSSSDDPNVDSIRPFEVAELPPDVSARFGLLTNQFGALGFSNPVHHLIYDAGTRTTIYWSTFLHRSGQHFARIHHRIWQQAQKSDRGLFPMFFTPYTDGTFLVSSAGKPDMAAPKTVQMNRMHKATADALWEAHLRLADSTCQRKSVSPINTQSELLAISERHHILMRDFHLARGVFRMRTQEEQGTADRFNSRVAEAQAGGVENPEVLTELERLQDQKPKWQTSIWLLGASLIGFVAAGAAKWDWKFMLWIIPILFFHEAGHWAAMRLFHYRNLRMFFIPFFGAAVTGRNWNVAGWKKALVSLAGPVPGIGLGIVLGLFGLVLHKPHLTEGALLLLFVNGFNLLPILPLDGGHVLQDLLFCRNRWLDGGFRILAIIGLVVLGMFGGMKLLMYVAIPLGFALPVVFKLSKVTDQLRSQALPAPAPDEDRIPPVTAQAIINSIRTAFPPKISMGHKIMAQHTLTVFERLNARPPGALATISLLALHGGALFISLVIGVLLVVAQHRGDFMSAVARKTQHSFIAGDIQRWPSSNESIASDVVHNSLVVTLKNRAAALAAFGALTNQVPEQSSLLRFGDSLVFSHPAHLDAVREQWFDLFQDRSTNVFVALSNAPINVSLSFLAPDRLTATNLELELNQYFNNTPAMHLVAPWSPAAKRPQFNEFRRLRNDWMRLNDAQSKITPDASLHALADKINAATRRGSTAEQQRLLAEQAARYQELRSRALAGIRSANGDPIDPELIELNRQMSSDSLTNETERLALVSKIAAKLGDVPYPPNDPFGLSSGFVLRSGLVFHISAACFYDVGHGLPALTDWLASQQCRALKYQLEGPGWLASLNDSEN